MAYCVQCGVKLADGAAACPLCNTPVLLPPTVVERKGEPLFAKKLDGPRSSGITKVRKGILELTLSLAVVALIAVGLSLTLSGLGRYSFIPIFSIVMVEATLVASLLAKPSYVRLSSIVLIGAGIYLVGLDLADLTLSWSLIASSALPLLWLFAVAPATKMKKWRIVTLSLIAVLLYLLIINITIDGALTWFLPVALPTMLLFGFLATIFALFLIKRKGTIIPISDVVLATLVVIFVAISGFDFFLTHYQRGFFALRWSKSLLWAALVALLFLLALSCSRRIRRYFTSHIRHS